MRTDQLFNRSFWQLIHASDHDRLRFSLSQLVLTKSGVARLRCRVCTSFADYFVPMDVMLKYGSLGVICSLWKSVDAHMKHEV